jgi:uncharacterized membrane protein YtjA (UPF0391 family)
MTKAIKRRINRSLRDKARGLRFVEAGALASSPAHIEKEGFMLNWALTFLVIGLIAGLFGFFGVAGVATQIAWILFVVFIVLFLVSLVAGRRGPPV